MDYTVYLNSGAQETFSADIQDDGKIFLTAYKRDVENKPIIKVPESAEYVKHSSKYLLQPNDIRKLKKDGFTEKISGLQIKQYLKKLIQINLNR